MSFPDWPSTTTTVRGRVDPPRRVLSSALATTRDHLSYLYISLRTYCLFNHQEMGPVEAYRFLVEEIAGEFKIYLFFFVIFNFHFFPLQLYPFTGFQKKHPIYGEPASFILPQSFINSIFLINFHSSVLQQPLFYRRTSSAFYIIINYINQIVRARDLNMRPLFSIVITFQNVLTSYLPLFNSDIFLNYTTYQMDNLTWKVPLWILNILNKFNCI